MKYRFLVTCATGDIGDALCRHLAKKGHDLIITARDTEKLEALSLRIRADFPGIDIVCFAADLGIPETMEELIMATQTKGVDGIVLMPPRPPILSAEPKEQFDILNKALTDCFTGPRYLLSRLLPCMESSSLKSVVLMSGASSKQPIANPKFEAFNDIRKAWEGCLKTFADNYGPEGIRFNTISPGQVVTPKYTEKLETEAQSSNRLYTEVLRTRTSEVPLRKFASVEGVVKTIYFYLKSSGSSETTAANVLIDGGATRAY